MTASKPPDKTLVGMPSDLKAVLQKLDQAAADKDSASVDQRTTRTGQAVSSERPRTAPPPLPSQRPTAAQVPTPQLPNAAAPAPNAAGPMDRTLIGMAPDMQAALQRALAEVSAPPVQSSPPRQPAAPAPARMPAPNHLQPTAAEPVQTLRAQPVRAIGVPGVEASSSQAHAARPPQPTAAAPAHAAALPRAAGLGHSGVPEGAGLGYQPASSSHTPGQPAMNVLAPQAPLDWPPARRSDPGPNPRAEGLGAAPSSQPAAASPSPLQPLAAEPAGNPEDALGSTVDAQAPTAADSARLALPLKTLDGSQLRAPKKLSDSPPKRWPAISLILLAVVAFGGVIVLRAPHLLPASLSALITDTPAVPDEMLAPEATGAPELPNSTLPALATGTSAATDPAKAAPTPTPTRPPAAPAMTSGASAQLEKMAIERLIANDYAGAKPLYEKLKSAEPARNEFGVMVELLNRASGAACGKPGQPACAGARP